MPPHQWEQVLAVAEAKPSKEDLIPVIKKLHQNLAPPNNDLLRMLRHGQASTEAIDVARHYEFEPKVPLPAQPNRVHEFNHQTGIDVKNLRGWLATESED